MPNPLVCLWEEGRGFMLSKRQEQIAPLLVRGMTAKEIAHELHITQRTCEGYIYALYRRLGVWSKAECVAHILTKGLLSPMNEGAGPEKPSIGRGPQDLKSLLRGGTEKR